MAEMKREREHLTKPETSAENYYDYEARFVKQRREQERINVLPRVINPPCLRRVSLRWGICASLVAIR